jgi:acyl-CoA synthetase (NDP forming)
VRRALRAHQPSFGPARKTLDQTPPKDTAGLGPAVRLVLESAAVAGAIAIDIGLDVPAYGEALAAAQAATGKPVVACTADVPEVERRLRGAGIPALPTPERAVRAYRALVGRATAVPAAPRAGRPPRARPPALAVAAGGALPYETARALLEHYGIEFPKDGSAASCAEALAVAGRIGYPVVLKTASPTVLHKTDAGGVVLDVRDEAGAREAYEALAGRFPGAPVLVQQAVPRGVELLVGGRRDPVFGPTVLFGLGGVLTELLREVALRLAPLADADALDLVRAGRAAAVLGGFRGGPAVDARAVAAAVTAVGDLLVEHPEVVELDVNPLIGRGEQVVAVDALVIVERHPEGGAS